MPNSEEINFPVDWNCVHSSAHCTAIWHRGEIIVFGGINRITFAQGKRNIVHIYNPNTNKWRTQICTGAFPVTNLFYVVEAMGDEMYVMCKSDKTDWEARVYVLNLENFCWKRLDVSGVPPVSLRCSCSCAWNGKIYIFGGFGKRTILKSEQNQIRFLPAWTYFANNQFVAFNTSTLEWEWPNCSGDGPPCPRGYARSFVSGDYMFIYGGFKEPKCLGSLHAIHLPSNTWRSLQQEIVRGSTIIPKCRCMHSLTLVGKNRAILYGGINYESILSSSRRQSDCWVLSWDISDSGIGHIKWTYLKKENHGFRFAHVGIYSQRTSRLYLIGGAENCLNFDKAAACTSILVSPQTLFEASLNKVAKCKNDMHCEIAIPSQIKEIVISRKHIPNSRSSFLKRILSCLFPRCM